VLGSPALEEASIHLENGRVFSIKTKGFSPENVYISSAFLNGEPLEQPWIEHEDIMQGGTLEITLSSKPNKRWGVGKTIPNLQKK
jgi:putative alpha-1,2-mannosidase